MALRYTLTAAQYENLGDEMKKEYISGEKAGEYVLDVSGLPKGEDVGPIKRALENERNKTKTLKSQLDDANNKIADFPDVETLKSTHEQEKSKLTKFAENALVDGEAAKLAAKISKSPALILPHIKQRLKADMDSDDLKTVVLDKDGKPSDMTIEKLGEEFVANKDFADIMIASKASGGGAPNKPSAKTAGGGAPGSEDKPFDAAGAKPSDLAARITARKEAAQQQ